MCCRGGFVSRPGARSAKIMSIRSVSRLFYARLRLMSKLVLEPRPDAAEAELVGVRERVLRAFSERAMRSGIRSVVMAELASDLRMSPNTVYNHFSSKKDLVAALVERWAREVGASEAGAAELASSKNAIDGMTQWAEAWSRSVARYAPAFWEDLRRDYPDVFEVFQRELRGWKERGAAELRPHLLPDLDADVALAVLDLILTHVSDPRFSENLGTSRRESIRTAIEIWTRGALRSRGQLRAKRSAGSRGSRSNNR